MFNKYIKLVLAALILAFSVWQFIEGYIGNGIMYVLLSGVFVFLYFKNELILMSFLRLRKEDFPGAKKWLDRIKNPKSALTTKQQGYYNYLNGLMVSQTNINEAEKIRVMIENLHACTIIQFKNDLTSVSWSDFDSQ